MIIQTIDIDLGKVQEDVSEAKEAIKKLKKKMRVASAWVYLVHCTQLH